MNPAIDEHMAGFAREDGAPPARRTATMPPAFGYFAVFIALWMVIMTARVYPQFRDTLREDGRLMSLSDYIEESCGQRIGPDAASCLEEVRATGYRLVQREQGRSILLIEAPLLLYLAYSVLALPFRLGRDVFAARFARHLGIAGGSPTCRE